MAKILGSISIRHRSEAKVSDRCPHTCYLENVFDRYITLLLILICSNTTYLVVRNYNINQYHTIICRLWLKKSSRNCDDHFAGHCQFRGKVFSVSQVTGNKWQSIFSSCPRTLISVNVCLIFSLRHHFNFLSMPFALVPNTRDLLRSL